MQYDWHNNLIICFEITTKCVASSYLLRLEGERSAVRVRFDAARIVRSGAVQDLHQALQRVLHGAGGPTYTNIMSMYTFA